MNQDVNDQDLEQAFAALRRATEASGQAFRAPRRAAARRVRWHGRPLAAMAVLLLAVAGVVAQRRAAARRALLEPFLTSTHWQSPTDYLLQTPGRDLLSAVPSIGTSANDTTVSRSDDSTINDSTNGG